MRIRSIGLLLLVCSSATAAPRFYQHQEVADFERQAEAVMREGYRIRGYPPFLLEPPVDWAADPNGDSNWRYQLNAMYPLGPVFQALMESDRPELRRFARRVFLDWIDFNVVAGRENPFKWDDMATGVRATYLAQLIHHEREARDILEADMNRLRDAGRMHVMELSDPARFAAYNHGIFQMIGIAALCEVEHYDECTQAMPYAKARFQELFDRQFNEEGMHLEHSPAYHLLALRVYERVQRSGLLVLDQERQRRLETARRSLHWLIHPDGGFAEFGDTEASDAFGAKAYDPMARWLVSHGKSGEPPPTGVAVFPATGYAFARLAAAAGPSYLALTVAHHSAVHKHADAFSFEWSDRGRRILVDSGKWAYEKAPERDYVTGPAAHNVVELQSLHFSRRSVPGKLPAVFAKQVEHRAVLRASGRHARGGSTSPRQERLLVLDPGEWLVVSDEVWSLRPRKAIQWFHLPPEAEVTADESGFLVEFPWADDVLQVFSLVPVDGVEAHRGRAGDDAADWAGWYSPSYGKLVPNWQIGFESNGFGHAFATVFRWIDAPEALASPLPENRESVGFCWLEDGRITGVRVVLEVNDMTVAPCE